MKKYYCPQMIIRFVLCCVIVGACECQQGHRGLLSLSGGAWRVVCKVDSVEQVSRLLRDSTGHHHRILLVDGAQLDSHYRESGVPKRLTPQAVAQSTQDLSHCPRARRHLCHLFLS